MAKESVQFLKLNPFLETFSFFEKTGTHVDTHDQAAKAGELSTSRYLH